MTVFTVYDCGKRRVNFANYITKKCLECLRIRTLNQLTVILAGGCNRIALRMDSLKGLDRNVLMA
jgi:hypothetical protein